MKRIAMAVMMLLLIPSFSSAAMIGFTNVSGTGKYFQGNELGKLSNLTDGSVPREWQDWQKGTTYFGRGGAQEVFTFDMGKLYDVKDVMVSLDNNDTYRIEYSVDNSSWSSLFTVSKSYGEVGWGMDTFSTNKKNVEYHSGIDFNTVTARYLRIYADHAPGASDGFFAIGEFQAFGTATPAAVPEPSTLLLVGAGLTGLALIRRKKN